jgi:hypothetical protein
MSMQSLADVAAQMPTEETEELRKSLLHTQRQLARAKAKVDDLVDAVYHATRDAIAVEHAFPPTPAPARDRHRKNEEPALWHVTDLQGGKLTAGYNREVMRCRLLQYAHKAKLITEIQRTDHPVRSAHLLLGGDMVEGLFNFPSQPFEIDATLFEQWASVSRLLVDAVRIALGIYERVTVIAEWGNHGRIGPRRSAVPRSDNLDRMCYETARMLLANEKRLTWEDCPEDIQKVEIGNYRAILLHGDEFGRSGYVSQSTFLAKVTQLKAGAFDWTFRDAYVGHYHIHDEHALPDGKGAVYWTGSTESENRYARNSIAAAGWPTQRLHFIDPEKGRVTSQHKIWLD